MDYDKLIERLKQHGVACVRTHGRYCSICDDAALAIKALRADLAPVEHGHWNDINPAVLKPGISWVCRCTLCGCPQDYKHNYCPNCGAKMDKEDEHETD